MQKALYTSAHFWSTIGGWGFNVFSGETPGRGFKIQFAEQTTERVGHLISCLDGLDIRIGLEQR